MVLSLALTLGALLSLDLTPIAHHTDLEGVPIPDFVFKDGDNQVKYRPPAGWDLAGGGATATVKPKETGALGQIQVRKLPTVQDFPPDAVKLLKEHLLKTLPTGADKIEWAEDQQTVLHMNRHDTYRITVSYSAELQRFTKTAVYCNFKNEQLEFSFVSREADFARLYELFRQSLFTFSGLE